jgi:hypothetical protein
MKPKKPAKPAKPAKAAAPKPAPAPKPTPAKSTSTAVRRLPATAGLSPEDKIRKLMKLMGAEAMGKQIIDQIVDTMVAQGAIPAPFAEKFKERAEPHELTERVLPLYLEHCDDDMIEAAIAFYEADTGQRFAKAQMILSQKAMIVGQAWGMELAQRAMKALEEDEQGIG